MRETPKSQTFVGENSMTRLFKLAMGRKSRLLRTPNGAHVEPDVVRLIDNAVELGIRLATADSSPTGRLRTRAANIYADVMVLAANVEDESDRQRIKEKLRGLSAALGMQTLGAS